MRVLWSPVVLAGMLVLAARAGVQDVATWRSGGDRVTPSGRLGMADGDAADLVIGAGEEFGGAVGIGVMCRVDEQWSLGARAGYVRQELRPDDSGFAPDGAGEDRRSKAGLVLRGRAVQLRVLGGLASGGELQIEKSGGDCLFKGDYDAAPFVGALLSLPF